MCSFREAVAFRIEERSRGKRMGAVLVSPLFALEDALIYVRKHPLNSENLVRLVKRVDA
jgi:hypothetical protein